VSGFRCDDLFEEGRETKRAAHEMEQLAWIEDGERPSGACKAAKRRAVHYTPSAMRSIVAEVEEMRASGEWQAARPRHFVALYEVLHHEVYGIEAPDIMPEERQRACFMAARVMAAEFDGDPSEMALFMAWAWEREVAREVKRREGKRASGRLGWHVLFKHVVGDYRVERVRGGITPKR
jgi:hypothetical protein